MFQYKTIVYIPSITVWYYYTGSGYGTQPCNKKSDVKKKMQWK